MNNVERFWAKVDKSGECWEWTGAILRNGYGEFGLDGKMRLTHRISYLWHHPLSVDLWEHREICVCHRCDNPKCVNPSHLFLGSQIDNLKDMTKKGRRRSGVCGDVRGEINGNSKLTEDAVREIRTRYAKGGITKKQLSLEYGISAGALGKVISRERWTHI